MYEKRRNFDAVFLNGTVESPERYRCAAGSRVAFGLIAIGREHKSGRTGGRLSVLSARARRVETPRTRSYYVRGIIRARTPSFPPNTHTHLFGRRRTIFPASENMRSEKVVPRYYSRGLTTTTGTTGPAEPCTQCARVSVVFFPITTDAFLLKTPPPVPRPPRSQ